MKGYYIERMRNLQQILKNQEVLNKKHYIVGMHLKELF